MITISLASMIGMKKDSKLHFSVLKITISNTIEFLNTLGTFTQAMTKWQIGCIGKLVKINLTTMEEMRIASFIIIGIIAMDFGMMHIVKNNTGLFVKKSFKAMIMEIRNMNKFNKSSKLVIFLEFFFEFTIFFSIETFHNKSRLCMQSFIIIGQGCFEDIQTFWDIFGNQ